MSANFENKKVVVEEIKNYAKDAKTIVLVDYKGLTVAEVSELRNAFRKAGATYKVYKNRLMKIAFESLGIKFDDSLLEGTTAVAFHSEDAIAPAKIAVDGENKYKALTVKASWYDGKQLDANETKKLASIPSKEVLVAQLVGLLTMPMRGLAVAISEIAKKNA
ncbi:MAG: 50S ribosomal protein L10 [Clostridia bacterium]|nr:50S ribosomal protein L10 [Clostridia bacterium]